MEQQRTTGRPTRQLNPEAKRALIDSAPAGIAAPVLPDAPTEQTAPPPVPPAMQPVPPAVQPVQPAAQPVLPATPAPAPRAQRPLPLPRSGRQRKKAPPKHPFLLRIPEDLWQEADRQAAEMDIFTHEYILEALAERVERGRRR